MTLIYVKKFFCQMVCEEKAKEEFNRTLGDNAT
jgi:hypothetical protein